MKHFLRDNGIWILIVALVLTGAISLATVFVPNLFSPVTHALGVVATPFRAAASFCVESVQDLKQRIVGYDEMEEKIAELEKQMAELEKQQRNAEAALEENQRLRDLLGLEQAHADFTYASAYVTARASTSWSSTLTLGKGSADGITKEMCVVDQQGDLIGVVTDVAANWSTVTTLIDPEISVGAAIHRTGDAGVLTGDLDAMTRSRCRLSYLSNDAAMEEGDTVVTSGLGGVYPAGLVVGTVIEEGISPSGMERYALVEPAVELESLRQVFVITDFDVAE